MTYTPKFTITSSILSSVGKIDACREVISTAPLVPAWERRFIEGARVRIIHHGTHLEGNNLNLDEVQDVLDDSARVTGKSRDIQEIINYRAVMDYLDSLAGKTPLPPITEEVIKEIHRLTVKGIMDDQESGCYRNVKVIIRNTATGEITFRPPPPVEVAYQMAEFFTWFHGPGKLIHPLLRAGILHYELVRIHPFTDGNGRTSRAASLLSLYLEGYQVKKFFSLEEYYDRNPGDYYASLQAVSRENDLTVWLDYYILGIAIEFERVKKLVQKLSLDLHLKTTLGGRQIALSDRQIKLVEYIERHGELGMSEARDLLKEVSDDTILRDLRDLVQKKLINKKGNTKGAKYFLHSK